MCHGPPASGQLDVLSPLYASAAGVEAEVATAAVAAASAATVVDLGVFVSDD